jgi:hypothetical protein
VVGRLYTKYKSTHQNVEKQVARDFNHGAVRVGYVTELYPLVLENGDMTEGLYHAEYGDGNEEDMDGREGAAATALAAEA